MLAILLHKTPAEIREMSLSDAEAVVKANNKMNENTGKR